jgi:molybdopterin-guanine dinucleotide biosynthesis protein A
MSFPDRVAAVVLAGGPLGQLQPEPGDCPASKGLLEIAGQPLARHASRALAGCQGVRSQTVVAPTPFPHWAEVTHWTESQPKLMGSFESGVLQAARDGDAQHPVLVCCGDLPFVQAEALDDFIARCRARPAASIWYGFLRKEVSQKAYPTLPHTWARLRDGTFCGSGVMMLRPSVMLAMRDAMERLTRARKNMFALAGCLGWSNLLAFALGRLTVARAEEAGARLFGVPCAGIETPYAELGFNIDDSESLQLARAIFQQRGEAPCLTR